MAKSEGGLKSGGASVQFRWPCPAGIESFLSKCRSPRGRGRSCATCLMMARKDGLSHGTHGIESIFFPELSPRLRPWR